MVELKLLVHGVSENRGVIHCDLQGRPVDIVLNEAQKAQLDSINLRHDPEMSIYRVCGYNGIVCSEPVLIDWGFGGHLAKYRVSNISWW